MRAHIKDVPVAKKCFGPGFFKVLPYLLLIAPAFFVRDAFYAGILFQTFLWSGLSGSWNLLGGYAGQASLGHTAYFGIGAYTSTLLAIHFGLSPWIGMMVGVLLSSLVGLALGAICFRLEGKFFVFATLAFGQIMYIIAKSWRSLTRGSEGLVIISQTGWWKMAFSSKTPYLFLALVYALIVLQTAIYFERSRFGYFLMAYRESDDAARSLGINTIKARLIASAISGGLMAVGGSIYARYMFYIDPDAVLSFNLAIQTPLISIVGGMGTAWGPIIGSMLILPLTQMLRAWFGSIAGLHNVMYGIILILVLLFIPEGIYPKLKEIVTMFMKGNKHA